MFLSNCQRTISYVIRKIWSQETNDEVADLLRLKTIYITPRHFDNLDHCWQDTSEIYQYAQKSVASDYIPNVPNVLNVSYVPESGHS